MTSRKGLYTISGGISSFWGFPFFSIPQWNEREIEALPRSVFMVAVSIFT
jgi:hypothetical protein